MQMDRRTDITCSSRKELTRFIVDNEFSPPPVDVTYQYVTCLDCRYILMLWRILGTAVNA